MPPKPCDPAAKIHAAPEVLSLIGADEIPITQADVGFSLGKITWASLKSMLDVLYNKYVHPNHSGDVTSVGDGVQTIAARAVDASKMMAVTTYRILGRKSAGAGNVEQLTAAEVLSIIGYEQGTFTPIIKGSASAGSGTYTTQKGMYIKIGNLVHFQLTCACSAHTGTGNMKVSGLPFTSNAEMAVHVTVPTCSTLTLPADSVPIARFQGNTKDIILYSQSTAGGSTSYVALAMDTACALYIAGTYIAAS